MTSPDDDITPVPSHPGGPDGDPWFDIRIGVDGTWYYQGSPITRMPLVQLFATVLRRDASGGHWLITPAERGRIRVDDAPFVGVALDRAETGGQTRLEVTTTLGDRVAIGAEAPLVVRFDPVTREPRPYVIRPDGLEILISRPVYYDLVDLAEPGEGRLGIWSAGRFFPVDDPLDPHSLSHSGSGEAA